MTVDPHVLFKEGEFTFRILSKEYRDEALVVLSRAFCTEPVCDAIAETDPKMKTNFLDWVEFVDYWMDHCSTNGMSVVALRKLNYHKLGNPLGYIACLLVFYTGIFYSMQMKRAIGLQGCLLSVIY